jgi:hypothetical protein
MFLSDKELQELTGLKRGAEQCAWLIRKGWVFETTAHGKPRVAVEYCKQRMGVQSEKPTRWKLNFA